MPFTFGSNVCAALSTEVAVSESIFCAGGTRPPLPITIGAPVVVGNVPGAAVTVGPAISVTVRLHAPEVAGQSVAPNDEPARNSLTVPSTTTSEPTVIDAAGALLVKTKIASDVATFPS